VKALLILNPAAGQHDAGEQLREVVAYLEKQGWAVTLRETRGTHDATTYAREAVAVGCDAVLVVGGDGSLGEAANGLAGSEVALGVLPVGTGNVWARQIGVPLHNPVAAAEAMADGEVRRIDLGRANGRYFLLWAGIGFDARVTQELETTDRELKRRLGIPAFILRGIVVALSFVGTRARLEIDGRRVRGRLIMAVISNARLYGAILPIAPEARLDDGLLDVIVFRGSDFLATTRHFIAAVFGQHLHEHHVSYYPARRVLVRAAKPMPVQADGDPIGATPMEFTVVPRALRVIVPRNVPKGLFM
jgi:YegS/Rv2252/BmrU family lipid kinase